MNTKACMTQRCIIIGIAGASASGKSLLANTIVKELGSEQVAAAEKRANQIVFENRAVTIRFVSREEAEKLGAEHEFGAKYPERVSVYSVGPKDATPENPKFDQRFSIEFCGGPHVTHTGELHKFRILKEEAVAQGVRRIKAVLE